MTVSRGVRNGRDEDGGSHLPFPSHARVGHRTGTTDGRGMAQAGSTTVASSGAALEPVTAGRSRGKARVEGRVFLFRSWDRPSREAVDDRGGDQPGRGRAGLGPAPHTLGARRPSRPARQSKKRELSKTTQDLLRRGFGRARQPGSSTAARPLPSIDAFAAMGPPAEPPAAETAG